MIAGGSAYPRAIDFQRLAGIASDAGAYFLVDMAHIAGLVAAGVHSSPVPHADVVTLTTTKTLRGPRGGVILSRREDLAKRLQSAVFPGVQGCLHPNVIAAKAVCFGEALSPAFRVYGARVLANARALAAALAAGGIRIVGGGTDTHMVLLDVSPQGLRGQEAEDGLAAANITSNRNPVPFDAVRPADWVGLRLGVTAATTRGFGVAEMTGLGDAIARVITAAGRGAADRQIEATRRLVARLCTDFPAG